jgi:predicted nuclease with TOPRIM domain
MRTVLSTLAALSLLALAAACGGSAGGDTLGSTGTVGVTVNTTAASQQLQDMASQAQAIVTTKLQQLSTSTSSSDVSARLEEAHTQLEDLAQRVEEVDTNDENQAEARDRLHDALHELSDQVEGARENVESGNAQEAFNNLMSSSAVTDLRQAIQSIQAQSG